MAGLELITIGGAVVLAVLVVVFLRMRRNDQIGELIAKRQQSGAKLVSRADYSAGGEFIPVALFLSDAALQYENPDMEPATIGLANVDSIEYDDELATGKSLEHGCRALRIRAHGVAFEFVLSPADCQKWMAALPQRGVTSSPARAAV